MSAVTITRARPWDGPAAARILSACIDEAHWLPRARSRAEEARILRDLIRRGWVRVARHKGRVVGFLALGDGEVHGLYLAPEARGQGIGAALLADAKAQSARLGLWAHAANHPARRFYAAQGFRPIRVGASNDERLTEIRYEWERVA